MQLSDLKHRCEVTLMQELQLFTYWHRHRAIVLIAAASAEEADRKFRVQWGSLSPVQSNVFEV